MLTPTDEQVLVRDADYGAPGLTVVNAYAGSGKTSTLEMVCDTNKYARILYLCYNKALQIDAKAKFPANTEVRTTHSLAYGKMVASYKNKIGKNMRPAEIAQMLGIKHRAAVIVRDTVAKFMQRPGMVFDFDDIPTVVSDRTVDPIYLTGLIEQSERLWKRMVDVNDPTPMPHDGYLKLWIETHPKLNYDILLLDEAQDTSPIVEDLILQQKDTKSVVLVGDRCQPTGTMVSIVHRTKKGNRITGMTPTIFQQVPIEDIKIGDVVVSYNIAKSFLRRTGSVVSGITQRPYTGNLVVVETEDGNKSKYTPDHHCIVRIGDALRGKYVVYLMKKGDNYRIGMTVGMQKSQGGRAGVAVRATQENADAFWILSVHDTRNEALLKEITTAWSYNIPDIVFSENNTTMSQEILDGIWNIIGNNECNANKVLIDHGRNILYPLWSKGQDLLMIRRSITTRAVNILNGMSVLFLTGAMDANGKRVSKNKWTNIKVYREWYDGMVYSMTIERDQTYVGDGIITHNCQAIYGWRGAVNAMERATNVADRKFMLTTAFRLREHAAGLATDVIKIVGDPTTIKPGNNGPEGMKGGSSVILSRTNASILKEAFRLVADNKRVHFVGTKPESGYDPSTLYNFDEILDINHLRNNRRDLMRTPYIQMFENYAQLAEIADTTNDNEVLDQDLVLAFSLVQEYKDSLPGMVDKIKHSSIDQAHADAELTTVHKSKGLEWDSVRMLSDFPTLEQLRDGMAGKKEHKKKGKKRKDRNWKEETNILYVGLTRARDHLSPPSNMYEIKPVEKVHDFNGGAWF